MDVKVAIETRRAYRALSPVEITDQTVSELARAAQLAPSCFNMQPWRYVFVHDPRQLERLYEAYSEGNEWARAGSLVIAVFSEKEADCVIREREYYLFDTGLATGQMLLRATEMDLVAHPIAGFSPRRVKEILGIPDEKMVIALIVLGGHSKVKPDYMTDEDFEAEETRPARNQLDQWVHVNQYEDKE